MVQRTSEIRIIGIGVCGGGESLRYMRKTLDEFKRLCDDVLIALCNATQAEKDLLDKYCFKYYEDNREWGVYQPDIKTDLLTKAGEMNPDWIVALDMDEVFAPEFTREEAEKLTMSDEIAYNFLVVNLYNDEKHFAHDVGIQRFWNIRFYKFLPEYGLQFLRKSLHCGLAPPIYYKYGWHAPYYLLHYGLMKPEDRAKKVKRYQQFDPNKRFKAGEYYNDLQRELTMRKWNPKELLNKLSVSQETQPRKTPKLK